MVYNTSVDLTRPAASAKVGDFLQNDEIKLTLKNVDVKESTVTFEIYDN